jgi:hypothetical protein
MIFSVSLYSSILYVMFIVKACHEDMNPKTVTYSNLLFAGVKLREGKKVHRRKSYRIATVFKAALMSQSSPSVVAWSLVYLAHFAVIL